MGRALTQFERDTRDLQILKLLDQGKSQRQVAEAVGVTRGTFQLLLKDIREDEASEARQRLATA